MKKLKTSQGLIDMQMLIINTSRRLALLLSLNLFSSTRTSLLTKEGLTLLKDRGGHGHVLQTALRTELVRRDCASQTSLVSH